VYCFFQYHIALRLACCCASPKLQFAACADLWWMPQGVLPSFGAQYAMSGLLLR
jgi:hypothetical protein